jgi:cytochrome c551/c552
MNFIKNMVRGIVFMFLLGLIILKSVEWSLYLFIAKPAAEEIAKDVASYVEANDRFFTEDTLNAYLEPYTKKDIQYSVDFSQFPNDHRFEVRVNVKANWDSIYSSTAFYHLRGVNNGTPPDEAILASFDSDDISGSYIKSAKPKKTEVDVISENPSQQENPQVSLPKEVKDMESPKPRSVNDKEIKKLVEDYIVLGMKAIEEEDFSYIKGLLDPEGKMYSESQQSINTINKKGMKEKVLVAEVQDIHKVKPNEFNVSTYEEFKITFKDNEEVIKGFESLYRVKVLENQRLAMNEILSIKEVFSETVTSTDQAYSQELLQDSCISCHGTDLEGGAGPALQHVSDSYTKEEIAAIIQYGRGIMPGGLVSPEDAERLAEYLIEMDFGHD